MPGYSVCFYHLHTAKKKSPANQELIIGNWKIDSVQIRRVVNNQVTYETISRPLSDYYDYRVDNKLYRRWQNNPDTVSYHLAMLNGSSLIEYSNNNIADTIISLSGKYLVIKSPQGSDSKIFFTKY